MLWASVLCVDRKDSRAMVIIRLWLYTAITPHPLPWTRETLGEESEDDEPARNLTFGVVDASGAAEGKSFCGGSSGLVRNKDFQVCTSW